MLDRGNTSPDVAALPEHQLRDHKELMLAIKLSRTLLPGRALFGEWVIVTGILQFTSKPLEPGGQ